MILRIAGFIWGVMVVALMLLFTAYTSRPGESGTPTRAWPKISELKGATDRPTLALFVDPVCPCSQATLANLERCLALCGQPPETKIVLVHAPPGLVPEGVVARLATVPHVGLAWDPQGLEAARFGVKTSGEVLVFQQDGSLAFSGGITPERGHAGDSSGIDAIVKISAGKPITEHTSSVYGCPL